MRCNCAIRYRKASLDQWRRFKSITCLGLPMAIHCIRQFSYDYCLATYCKSQERMLITLVSSYRGDPLGGISVGFSIANIFNSHTTNIIYTSIVYIKDVHNTKML